MLGCSLELVVREIVRCHRHEPRGRPLDDLHAADAIRLEPGEARRRDPPGSRCADRLHVLEAVQQRKHDGVLDRLRIDALERLLEMWAP